MTLEGLIDQMAALSQPIHATLYGGLLGVLSLAMALTLLTWHENRRPIDGLFVIFLFFSLMIVLFRFPLESDWQGHALFVRDVYSYFAIPGFVATAFFFTACFLKSHSSQFQTIRPLNWMAIIFLIIYFLALFLAGSPRWAWGCALVAITIYCIISFIFGFRLFLKTSLKSAGYSALANLTFGASLMASVLLALSGSREPDTRYALWEIGLVSHIAFLMMALFVFRSQIQGTGKKDQPQLAVEHDFAGPDREPSKDLKQLIGRLAHEFKTPLAVIDSSVQSLMMLTGDLDSERMTRYTRIRRAVLRLNELLMRSFSEEEKVSDHAEQHRSMFSLVSLLEVVLEEFSLEKVSCLKDAVFTLDESSQRGIQRQIKLHWLTVQDPQSLQVYANMHSLHAALYHVLDNAAKYGVKGADLEVGIRLVNSTSQHSDVAIDILNACDPELNQDDLQRLFERYCRRGEQGNIPGAGVGLYIASQAIEHAGGSLEAFLQAPGKIVFRVQLPLSQHDSNHS